MRKRLLNRKIAAILPSICACTMPMSASAIDYDVLEGSFIMVGVTPAPELIEGNGDADPIPGFPNVGIFSEGVFDGSASGCCTAPNDPLATKSGLGGFLFFGSPVDSYFAPNGVDAETHLPPTIDITGGTADFSSFYANWNGTEFNQGADQNDPDRSNQTSPPTISTRPVVNDNSDGTYTVEWESLIVGGPFNGFVGGWTMRVCPSPCQLASLTEVPTLSTTQATFTTRTLTQGVGDAVVSFDPAELVGGSTAGFTFNWGATDDVLDGGAVNTGSTLTILQADIDAATPGIYKVVLNLTDTNVTPNESGASTLLLKIVPSTTSDENDVDNDGIPNFADGIIDPAMLQAVELDQSTFVMTTSAGSLKQGDTAFCSGKLSAVVAESDVVENGGDTCASVANGVDETFSVETGIGGLYDFEVHGLSRGATADVVIPLNLPIKPNAGYRVYTVVNGWQPFEIADGDKYMSAAGSAGVCPSASSTEWVDGFVNGHWCIKLSIADGGPNDADGGADGRIKDPGGMSSYPGVTDVSVGGGFGLLLGLPLLLLRLISSRRK